jgi:hypothetical protein
MAQLNLYLDPAAADRLDAAAKRAGKSRSAWAREVIDEKLSESERGWPPEFLATYGSWEGEGKESLEAIIRQARAEDMAGLEREEFS